ncbi:unnamed protein product [Paramecium sonneborni]|uniref:Uncharacterized protein n=1 Tax=Paramecium sonneborni TaxID=65129 RepID=A0A8S1QFR0_9CILI|nr:unnamed protein product [Paramecium sonneborni]
MNRRRKEKKLYFDSKQISGYRNNQIQVLQRSSMIKKQQIRMKNIKRGIQKYLKIKIIWLEVYIQIRKGFVTFKRKEYLKNLEEKMNIILMEKY